MKGTMTANMAKKGAYKNVCVQEMCEDIQIQGTVPDVEEMIFCFGDSRVSWNYEAPDSDELSCP